MSQILYYSNYCQHCKGLLRELSKSMIKDNIHFLCIDKRVRKNGTTYIQLENGQELLLPPNIQKVPALLLLNRGNTVLQGESVNEHLFKNTKNVHLNSKENIVGEPLAFSLNDFGTVMSDNFSFLDQSSDELSAKGEGGMRQMHNYVAIHQSDIIETPPDDYVPDKIGSTMTLDKVMQMRENDVPRRQQPRI